MPQNAFDITSIPRTLQTKVIKGLETEESSFAEKVCTIRSEPTTLQGSIPLLLTVTTLARPQNVDLGPLEEAKPHGGKMGKLDYNCRAQVGYDLISDEQEFNTQYFSESAIETSISNARRDANAAVDLKFAAVLEDTTENNVFDAATDGSGQWSDYVNSRPLNDMLKMKRAFSPGADTVVMDLEVAEVLVGNPHFISEFANFSSGQLELEGLAAFIGRKIGVRNVWLFDKMYNEAPIQGDGDADEPGIPNVVFKRFFEKGFWMGHKAGLQFIKPKLRSSRYVGSDRLEVSRVSRKRGWEVQYSRHIDIKRALKELGTTSPGVIA